jgi:hypothetical protein
MSDKKTSRPAKYKTIDRNLVYRLACIQCTDQEIAEVVGTTVDTLKRRFGTLLEKGRHEGRQSLRRSMYEKAIDGDTRLQIFLSKQYLGMRDTPEDTQNTTPLPWSDDD